MKYKVGDKVKIREDLKIDDEYKGFFVNDHMVRFLGETGVISEKFEDEEYYEIEGFDVWCWTDEMIEGRVEFGDKVDVRCDSEPISENEMKKSLVECELSIGENDVRINSDCFYLNSAPYEAEEVDVLIELLQETKKIYEQFNG